MAQAADRRHQTLMNTTFTTPSQLPDTLVQYVARDLLRRAEIIKLPVTRVREISSAPLPAPQIQAQYPKAKLEQWRMSVHAVSQKQTLLRKLNPFATALPIELGWSDWAEHIANAPAASLVFAPFVLDGLCRAQIGTTVDVLAQLEQLSTWFAADGVLLFATLGAGTVPQLVNRDPDWLTHFQHLPTIMNLGRCLQDLRFGLPVLDVETVRMGYDDAQTMWQDVCLFSPSLNALPELAQREWRHRVDDAFAHGVRELSLEVIYAQVWQPSAAPAGDDGVRTVSLESLTASLKNRPLE